MKKYFIIHEYAIIASVEEYDERTAIMMPDSKGVIINSDKAKVRAMLTALGVTDFTLLDSFKFEE